MNRIALAALAITAAGAPALAGTDPWSNIDRDFAKLASSLSSAGPSGVTVTGFLRTSYMKSDDTKAWTNADASAGGGNETFAGADIGGFSIDDARLVFTGTVGRFGVTIEVDGTNGTNDLAPDSDNDDANEVADVSSDLGVFGQTSTASTLAVLDAYATWNFTNDIRAQVGSFRAPFLASAMVNENDLLFMDRSILGTTWSDRDEGVLLTGNMGMGHNASWGFALAAQNGGDTSGKDLSTTARVHMSLMNAGWTEGAVGAANAPALSVGISYFDDDNNGATSMNATGFDAKFTFGQLAVSGEMVDYNSGMGLSVPDDVTGIETLAGETPYAGTISFRIDNPQTNKPMAELALRYEDLDDQEESTILTYGANWYFDGHASKLQVNYSSAESDDTARDMGVLQVGLTVSI